MLYVNILTWKLLKQLPSCPHTLPAYLTAAQATPSPPWPVILPFLVTEVGNNLTIMLR